MELLIVGFQQKPATTLDFRLKYDMNVQFPPFVFNVPSLSPCFTRAISIFRSLTDFNPGRALAPAPVFSLPSTCLSWAARLTRTDFFFLPPDPTGV